MEGSVAAMASAAAAFVEGLRMAYASMESVVVEYFRMGLVHVEWEC